MTTQTTDGGSTTSFMTTPQAKDDNVSAYEDYVFCFDVMSNDLGGNAKILWSIDDTDLQDDSSTVVYDLLTQDTSASVPEYSEMGAKIRIVNGKIQYDTNSIDYLGENQTEIDSFTYAIRLANGTLSWATVYVTLTGKNDAPAIVTATDVEGDVTEDALPTQTSGSFTFSDVDLIDTHSVTVTPDDSGYLGSLNAVVSNDSTDDGSGQVNWRFVVDNAAIQYLADGETVTQKYTVTVDDGHGGTAEQVITITITGTNDQPTLTVDDAAGDMDEEDGAAILSDNGSLSFADLDATDIVTVSASYNDDIAWSGGALDATLAAALVDGFSVDQDSWDYSASENLDFLGDGETITLTFDVLATDDSGTSTDTSAITTVTITITGTNDAPEVTSEIANATTDEDSSYSLDTSAYFTDVDHGDTLTYSAELDNGDPLPAWLTIDPDTGILSGTPENGDVAVYTIVVTATDENGASASDTFELTVNNVNDAAVITGDDARSITEDAVPNTVSGNLDSSDVDGVDDSWQAQTIASTNAYGSLQINANGTWTYTLDNTNATVDALNDASPPLTDTFTVKAADGTEHQIVITINGHTDSAPYVSPAVFTGTGDPNDFDNLGNPADQNLSNAGTNGPDTLYGGAGADTINGGNGDDTIYGGSGTDNLNGGVDGDRLFGGSGNDTVVGANNDDVIVGGYGADTLTGSNGADTFFYLSQKDTGDTITDFSKAAGDKIKFDTAFGFDSSDFAGAIATAGAVNAGQFGFKYDAGTNTTIIYVDTDGVFGADMEIKLTGNIVLDGTDFLFGGI